MLGKLAQQLRAHPTAVRPPIERESVLRGAAPGVAARGKVRRIGQDEVELPGPAGQVGAHELDLGADLATARTGLLERLRVQVGSQHSTPREGGTRSE
ncbi:MAG: hypothetical protein L3K11_04535 [Thermoplasmata archaeon]|nr:hypothetical protein [Thermoplasmata archaeon]